MLKMEDGPQSLLKTKGRKNDPQSLLKTNKLLCFCDESLKEKEIEGILNRVSNADLVFGILNAD